ncbi:hypothetical protein GOP47_0007631 [Adiantum capillus-veneris]|uniref:Uncharacterized protein n=1 Tax=Adiantum capillus-veneris TaxID=13818 RepID=A0A9D4V1Y0_ADICA|nr:hypothetical protein GOP47_0007631 [Adiantum capillus-veneris]
MSCHRAGRGRLIECKVQEARAQSQVGLQTSVARQCLCLSLLRDLLLCVAETEKHPSDRKAPKKGSTTIEGKGVKEHAQSAMREECNQVDEEISLCHDVLMVSD